MKSIEQPFVSHTGRNFISDGAKLWSIHLDNINLPENALTTVIELMIIPTKLCVVIPVVKRGTTRLPKFIKCYSVTYIQPFES